MEWLVLDVDILDLGRVVPALTKGFFEKKAVMVDQEMDFGRYEPAFVDREAALAVREGDVGGAQAAVSELDAARPAPSHPGRDRFHPVRDQSLRHKNVRAGGEANRDTSGVAIPPV